MAANHSHCQGWVQRARSLGAAVRVQHRVPPGPALACCTAQPLAAATLRMPASRCSARLRQLQHHVLTTSASSGRSYSICRIQSSCSIEGLPCTNEADCCPGNPDAAEPFLMCSRKTATGAGTCEQVSAALGGGGLR